MIETTITKIQYDADGVQRRWSIPFPYADVKHISIYTKVGEEPTVKVVDNYDIDEDDSVVIYPTVASGQEPLSAGTKIIIARETPETQLEDASQVHFTSKDVERGLDKLTMITQELSTTAGETMGVSASAFGAAEEAVNTANEANATAGEAKTLAEQAVSVANDANATATTANTKSDTAIKTANDANEKSTAAVSTANAAKTVAGEANSTANKANATAMEAKEIASVANTTANNADKTANEADKKANNAVIVANNAKSIAEGIDGKATQALANSTTALEKATEAKNTADSYQGQITTIRNDVDGLSEQVSVINAKIPQAASDSNQLVDKASMTSAIAAVQKGIDDNAGDITALQADLAGKQDKGDYATNAALTTGLNQKADKANSLSGYGITDAFTKEEVNAELGKKADKATTYSKTEVDNAINSLQMIKWVDSLPETGESKYIYAVPREEVDKDGKKIAALYLWDGTEWRGAGAFSLNIDPDTLATKTELAGYLPLTSKAVANGVASLDENAKVPVAQIPDLSSTYATINSLATVATSGSYEDLINKPTIPSAVTETTVSGWGFTKNTGTVTGVKINGTTKNPTNGIVDVGTVITQHQDISGKQDKITSTNKLSADLVADGTTNKVVTASEKAAWNGKQDTISDLATIRSGASAGATAVQPDDLAKVATSGSYTDLTNKPTIPTVNNGTLTIQKNGTNVATFTANQSTASTANIEVPTKLSELTDDLGSSPVHTHSQYSTVANTVTNVVAGSTADKINVTKNGSTSTITINNVANATNATKATKDADGNTISTTYAKKSTLATVAISGMYSDLTGTPGAATTDTLGLVKPDGNTITVTADGVISATGGSGSGSGFDFEGTKAEFDAAVAAGTITDDSVSLITDDVSGDNVATKAELQAVDSSKADTALSNVLANIDYVVESQVNADGSWYRKYKSGWLEQGGLVTVSGTVGATVTLLKPFANTAYNIQLTLQTTNAVGYLGATAQSISIANSKTTTSFGVQTAGIQNYEINGISWCAEGQGA